MGANGPTGQPSSCASSTQTTEDVPRGGSEEVQRVFVKYDTPAGDLAERFMEPVLGRPVHPLWPTGWVFPRETEFDAITALAAAEGAAPVSRRHVVVTGMGDPCPRCGRATEIREHRAITSKGVAAAVLLREVVLLREPALPHHGHRAGPLPGVQRRTRGPAWALASLSWPRFTALEPSDLVTPREHEYFGNKVEKGSRHRPAIARSDRGDARRSRSRAADHRPWRRLQAVHRRPDPFDGDARKCSASIACSKRRASRASFRGMDCRRDPRA